MLPETKASTGAAEPAVGTALASDQWSGPPVSWTTTVSPTVATTVEPLLPLVRTTTVPIGAVDAAPAPMAPTAGAANAATASPTATATLDPRCFRITTPIPSGSRARLP